jgi:iron complex outermembrane receptor protein
VRGHVNIAAYHSDYSNIQRNETLPAAGGTVFTQINNIAAAKIDGIEIESEFRIGERLKLGANFNYTNGRYINYPGTTTTIFDPPAVPAVIRNNVDTPYVGTPKGQFSINARYAIMKSDDMGEIALSGNYYHQSSVHLDDSELQDPKQFGFQKGFGTLNLRVDWNNIAGQAFDASINVTNVTQTVYKVGVANLLGALGIIGGIYNEPRMITGSIRFRF